MNKLFYIVVLSLSSFTLSAKINTHKIGGEIFRIYSPENWQIAKNFLNAELTLFGPYVKTRRPIMAFNKIPLMNYKIKISDLEKGQQEYRSGRLIWLKKNSGKLIKFKAYKQYKWNGLPSKVHTIGYTYKIFNESFHEDTYFFKCNNKVFNVSTLLTFNQRFSNLKTINKIQNSISCNKK